MHKRKYNPGNIVESGIIPRYGMLWVFVLTALRAVKSLMHHYPLFVWFCCGAVIVYSILLVFIGIWAARKNPMGVRRMLPKFRKSWIQFLIVIGLGLILFRESVIIVATLENKRMEQEEVTITKEELENLVKQNKLQQLADNELLKQGLQTDYYMSATEEEKLEILALIAGLEAEHLGIEVPEIKAVYLEESVGGYYNHDQHQIVLNLKHLSHEKCSIKTVIHESYHAYQTACIHIADNEIIAESKLLWAREIMGWKEEYRNIANDLYTDEGLAEYYTQTSEQTAREYAEQRQELYFTYLSAP